VRAAVEREFARQLTDVLHVSTYWGYERKITREFVEPIAREMARLLGWDEEHVRRQVAAGGITDDGDLTAEHAVPQN
jgi:CO/xanthine dehydrogenase Mo-binding subunit